MKKGIIYIVLFLYSVQTWGQNDAKQSVHKLSYGLYISPMVGYRHLSVEPGEEWFKQLRNDNEVAKLSFSAGFLMDHVLTKDFNLSFGLEYTDRGFQSKVTSLTWASTGTNLATETYTSYHYRYFDVPLNVKYYFYQKDRLRCYASAGLSLALLFNYHKINHTKTDGRWAAAMEDKGWGYNRVNLAVTAQMGIEYNLLETVKLAGALFFQQATLVTTPTPTKEYLFNGGVRIGIIYTPLKKNKS